MNNDLRIEANGGDYPLDREDVQGLLLEAGNSGKLNLSNRNLRGIDFSNFDLTRANLSGANLSGANLSGANLSGANLLWVNLLGADLQGANLRGANLNRAQLSSANLSGIDLSGTDLSRTYLSGVILREANLKGANLRLTQLSEVDLSGANLSGTILNGTDLTGANLSNCDLSGADLSGADLRRANLNGAYMTGAKIPEHLKRQLGERGVLGLDEGEASVVASSSAVHVRITEEPLTVYNVATIFSFLNEFSIKCWLIAKHRFADLKEYTQTRDGRFVEEAPMTITMIAYTPHLNMDWGIDTSTPSIAEALITAFDGIIQIRKRLENQSKLQEIQHTAQKDDYGYRLVQLEREERELEIATEVIAILQPTANEGTRAMLIQMILPDLLQFYRGKGLELALSESSVQDLPKDKSRGNPNRS